MSGWKYNGLLDGNMVKEVGDWLMARWLGEGVGGVLFQWMEVQWG